MSEDNSTVVPNGESRRWGNKPAVKGRCRVCRIIHVGRTEHFIIRGVVHTEIVPVCGWVRSEKNMAQGEVQVRLTVPSPLHAPGQSYLSDSPLRKVFRGGCFSYCSAWSMTKDHCFGLHTCYFILHT